MSDGSKNLTAAPMRSSIRARGSPGVTTPVVGFTSEAEIFPEAGSFFAFSAADVSVPHADTRTFVKDCGGAPAHPAKESSGMYTREPFLAGGISGAARHSPEPSRR